MDDYSLTDALLCGRDSNAMVDVLGCPVHPAIVAPFEALQSDAARAGFDLKIVSGFRSFDRQLAIWNAKASGQRPLLDSHGQALDYQALSKEQLLEAILRWSALPGASRHHWGSDIDVYDAGAVDGDYAVQLSPQEVEGDGPFAPLHDWLDHQLGNGASYGFFRPYAEDRGGIAPERWHLSYAPLSARCEAALNVSRLRNVLAGAEMVMKKAVLDSLPALYDRFVSVPRCAYPSAYTPLLAVGEEH